MVQVHRVACLLGTSIGVGTSVCLLAGLAASYATETDPLLGVTAGGVFGVLLSVGVFIGAASNLDVKGSGKLSEPLVPSGADVTHTFKKKAKMGIAFAVRRSTRDGNRWLVVAELAKLGQAAAVPGIAPGMAVKSAQGQPLDLGEFKSVLRERPLEVTFGVVDREPGAPPVPPPPEEEPDEGEEEAGEEPDEPEPEPEEGAGEEEGGDDASPPPLPGPPPLDELPGPPPGPPPDELPGPPPGPPPPEEPVDVGKLEMIFRYLNAPDRSLSFWSFWGFGHFGSFWGGKIAVFRPSRPQFRFSCRENAAECASTWFRMACQAASQSDPRLRRCEFFSAQLSRF